MEGRAVGHTFERDPPRDHPCQVWFNLFQRFQRKRFKCDLLSKYAKRYKLAERKISQKNREYMLNYSFPCSCSKNLSSFWLILKQQWTIEEISIFSNSSHLEWRAGLSDTLLKGTHTRTIPARFGLRWYHTHSSFSLCGFDHWDAWNLHTNIIWSKRSTDFKELSPCSVWYPLNLVQGFQRRRFKCESLQRTTDAKWCEKLTWPLARQAKKG
jgi:hypothetical protein